MVIGMGSKATIANEHFDVNIYSNLLFCFLIAAHAQLGIPTCSLSYMQRTNKGKRYTCLRFVNVIDLKYSPTPEKNFPKLQTSTTIGKLFKEVASRDVRAL